MATEINRDVANGIWEITFFLSTIYAHINENESLEARGDEFGGDKKTDEYERSCAILFKVKIAQTRGDVIHIGFYGYNDMQGAENSCIYIEQLPSDEDMWQRLKNQFPDPPNKIIQTDDNWWIVIDWPHGQGATAEQIEASAKDIGDKIILGLLDSAEN